MDTFISSWLAACLALMALTIGLVAYLRERSAAGASHALRETPMVALVRRRRELNAQLRELAGDGGSNLLQAEAKRMGASAGNIDVLEAAVARAERGIAR